MNHGTTFGCGCRITTNPLDLLHCPLHAQAPALRAALENLLEAIDNHVAIGLWNNPAPNHARAVLQACEP